MENVFTGDVLLFDRQCLRMKDPLAASLCLVAKLGSPFDHVGVALVASDDELKRHPLLDKAVGSQRSPSHRYVVEANVGGVTVRSLEARLARSSSNAIAVRHLHADSGPEAPTRDAVHTGALRAIDAALERPYASDIAVFLESALQPPDKGDRIRAAGTLHVLEREVAEIDAFLASAAARQQSHGEAAAIAQLRATYAGASAWLRSTYFPQRFTVDGKPEARSECFCSQLLWDVWRAAGVVRGDFPVSTGVAPCDFDPATAGRADVIAAASAYVTLGPPRPLPNGNAPAAAVCELPTGDELPRLPGRLPAPPPSGPAFWAARLLALSRLRVRCGWDPLDKDELIALVRRREAQLRSGDAAQPAAAGAAALLPMAALVPSTMFVDDARGAPWRVFWCGAGSTALMAALSSLELAQRAQQLGVRPRCGALVYSLGVCARGLSATVLSTLLTALLLRRPLERVTSGSADGALAPRVAPPAGEALVDWHHPYWSVCVAGCGVACALATMATAPIANAVMARCFAPQLPGPRPLRQVTRGAWRGFFAPALWVPWFALYEGPVQLLLATPSSVLRQSDAIDRSDAAWGAAQRRAIGAACGLAIAGDVLLYPVRTWLCRRKLAPMFAAAGQRLNSAGGLWSGVLRRVSHTTLLTSTSAAAVYSFLL